MKEILLKAYDFNLKYARALVTDVDEAHFALAGPKGLENHPAFTIGHLCTGAAITSQNLGGSGSLPEGWNDLFRRNGPGDGRLPDTEQQQYPSKEELINELARLHEAVSHLIRHAADDLWDKHVQWRFSEAMPTMADLTYFMCITHENMHLGQLPAWRRHFGYPSALATLYPK